MKDKHGLLKEIQTSEGNYCLELGCGNNKSDSSFIGIDLLDTPAVDVVGDVYTVLKAVPRESISAIYSSHFVEHIPDLQKFLTEAARVLKPSAKMEIVVPHFSNPWFYSDPTHTKYFGLYTMSYFSVDNLLSRKVPTYDHEIHYDLQAVNLTFKSGRPFYGRHIIRAILGKFFNSTNYLKEFWEENLSGLISCYEISYTLVKRKN